jgi:hypothetical protein
MSAVKQALQELLGLFVEDGSLALAILAVVAAGALLALTGVPKLAIGGVLLGGCLAVLAENVWRAQHPKAR